MASSVLSEPGGVVKTKHVSLGWIDVEDGSVEPLLVVIHEAVWHGCCWCTAGIDPGVIIVPSGNPAMLIVTLVLVSMLGYGGDGLLGLL